MAGYRVDYANCTFVFLSRVCLSLALTVFLFSPAYGQLAFDPPLVNLGEMKAGPVYSQTVSLRNVGTLPLEIVDIRRGCNCVEPRLSTRILKPQERAFATIALRSLGQAEGDRTWRSTFVYQLGEERHEAELVLRGKLTTEIRVEPSALSLEIARRVQKVITIQDRRPVPFTVKSVDVSHPGIETAIEQTPGAPVKIHIDVAASSLRSIREEATLAITTNDPDYRQLVIPITLIKASETPVQAVPQRVIIHGERPSSLVRLRSPGGRPIVIESATCSLPGVKLTWANGSEVGATLRVTFSASIPNAGPLPSIEVRCSEPAGATVTIPLSREDF